MSIDPAKKVTATAYVVLQPEIRNWGGADKVTGIKFTKLFQNKPSIGKGQIAVKVSLNFDKEQLLSAIPEVSADVTAFHTVLSDLLTEP